MLAPLGSQPSSVYWRRRLVLLVSVLVLVVLVALIGRALLSGDSGASTAAAATSSSPTFPPPPSTSAASSALPASRAAPRSSAASTTSRAQRGEPVGSASSGPTPSVPRSSSPPPKSCRLAALGLAAQTGQTNYSVGDEPVLAILVTNPDAEPCVQDLADAQITLRVYNGESRIWGSHDCKTEPGTDGHTLMGRSSVRVSVVWSGQSSQPKCAGTRQRVGAGTYTLYASLAGREAKAAQFSIT